MFFLESISLKLRNHFLHEHCLSLVSKTDSGLPNNTYLNNFDIFNKVLKKPFEIKNFKIKNLIGTPTPNKRIILSWG